MPGQVYPLFRDYSLAVKSWLQQTVFLPRLQRLSYGITKITRVGTAGGGVNQHEVWLNTKAHEIKQGHPIVLTGTTSNDEYYMVASVFEEKVVLDPAYKTLKAEQAGAGGTLTRTINVIYGNIDKSVSAVVQPLRNGQIDSPGIGFYITSMARKEQGSRPIESFDTRRLEGAGGSMRVYRVPPLQTYTLAYSINVWAVYMQEMDILNYQIATEFSPDKFFWVGDPAYGMSYAGDRGDREFHGQWAHATMDSITDASDLETGSPTRTLRTEIGITFSEAYLPMPFDDQQPFIGAIDFDILAESGPIPTEEVASTKL